jgi:hypothetical protein
MEFTNKTLALLLVVTLVLSMSGTLLSLSRLESFNRSEGVVSGRAGSDIGNVTLQINNTASLIFTVKAVNFGSGSVNSSSGALNCSLNSMGLVAPYNCVGFTAVTQGLVLENDGNQNLSVELASNVNNITFIGGTQGGGSRFDWNVTENETGTCKRSMFSANGTFVQVNDSAPGTLICGDMNWNQNDTFLIHVFINIPANSASGQRNATLTATGSITP